MAIKNLSRTHQDKVEIVRKTHENFCGIKKKDVALLGGDSPGATDTASYVKVPFEDDEVDLVHKHEWQHIFFLTDLPARTSFVYELAASLIPPTDPDRTNTDHFISFLADYANALDDIRVARLWVPLYPTSGRRVLERWTRVVHASKAYPTSLVHYTIGIGIGALGHDVKSQWRPWFRLIKEETELLSGAPFIQVLIATKRIVETIFEEVSANYELAPSPRSGVAHRIGKFSGEVRSEAIRNSYKHELVNLLVETNGILLRKERFADLEDVLRYKTTTPEGSQISSTVMRDSPELADLLKKETAKLEAAIQSLRPQPKVHTDRPDVWPGLVIKKVSPGDVKPVLLSPQESSLAHTLKSKFAVLYGRRTSVLSEEGVDLDIPAFINMRFSGESNIYRDRKYVRGFSAILLVDMSGSMLEAWSSVGKAAKILATAMNIPRARLEVWGFTGDDSSDVIYQFEDPAKGYEFVTDKHSVTWGLTPLHVAVSVALETLARSHLKERHLILVTDGIPSVRCGSLKDRDAVDLVSKAVASGRSRRVEPSPLILGSSIDLPTLEAMFGPRGWTHVTEDGLMPALVSLLQEKIVASLRRRF